jgi:putative membrane protein insertion efficiency factor
MNKLFIFLIRIYQNTLGIIFPPSCRYYPSCSEFSIQALQSFGILKGSWLSFKRILKCNPFSAGGYDPVSRHNLKKVGLPEEKRIE